MKTKDLTAMMAAIADAHICNFYSDFEHDKRSIESEFAPEEEVSQRFIWMTRNSGTHFSFVRDIPSARLHAASFFTNILISICLRTITISMASYTMFHMRR